MHELGYSDAHYTYIAVGWLEQSLVQGDKTSPAYNATSEAILREALRGSLMFFPASFVGSFGEQFKQEFEMSYGRSPIGYSAYAFDAALTVGNALEYLVRTGKDYNNPSYLMSALRKQNFIGATGRVSFGATSNDREPVNHIIANLQEVSQDNWQVKEVGLFSPSSSQVFSFQQPVLWNDLSTNVPSDSPPVFDCPFDPDLLEKSLKGSLVVLFTSLCYAALGGLGIAFAYRRWNKVAKVSLKEKFKMNSYDIIAMASAAIEVLQYQGLAPTLPGSLTFLDLVSRMVSLNLEAVFSKDREAFWIVYTVSMALAFTFIIIRAAALFRLVSNTYIINCLPFIGDSCQLAICNSLLDILQCPNALNDGSAPFAYDCFETCWSGRHLSYMIAGSFVLVLFAPAVNLERPVWQDLKDEIMHVKQVPRFLVLKSALQVLLVVLKKVLARQFPTVYAVTFTLSLMAFTCLTLKLWPYSYDRVNLWYSAGLMTVTWTAAVSTVRQIMQAEFSYVWLGCLCGGPVFFGVVSLALMCTKFPSFVIQETLDKQSLFRFAFRSAQTEQVRTLNDKIRRHRLSSFLDLSLIQQTVEIKAN
jgi:hypothetical protein